MKKLSSLTLFFPFYNDAGTIDQAIAEAYKYGREVANIIEVIAIHGGPSEDNTFAEIQKQKQKHKDLIIMDKRDNWESYAVIKYGFRKATKDWIFYTDGDLQYDLRDLKKLVAKHFFTGADVINGYKESREDRLARVIFGNLYQALSRWLFHLPIRDLTCDFRLIKGDFIKDINLESHDASILLELIKKLEQGGAKFAEVSVNHRPRAYRTSSYTIIKLLKERIIGDIKVWLKLLYNKHL